jgi:hypothetical protein
MPSPRIPEKVLALGHISIIYERKGPSLRENLLSRNYERAFCYQVAGIIHKHKIPVLISISYFRWFVIHKPDM